jgi:hypothetical protein
MSENTISASPSAIREWAKRSGIRVGIRGPIHADVVKAYQQAHVVPVGDDE